MIISFNSIIIEGGSIPPTTSLTNCSNNLFSCPSTGKAQDLFSTNLVNSQAQTLLQSTQVRAPLYNPTKINCLYEYCVQNSEQAYARQKVIKEFTKPSALQTLSISCSSCRWQTFYVQKLGESETPLYVSRQTTSPAPVGMIKPFFYFHSLYLKPDPVAEAIPPYFLGSAEEADLDSLPSAELREDVGALLEKLEQDKEAEQVMFSYLDPTESRCYLRFAKI